MNKKEKSDKIKKLLEDVKEIEERINSLKAFGKQKEVKKHGSGGHICLPKKFVGRQALVIVLPEIEKS